MNLIPKRPPGRATRKARAFDAEIWRLHVEGHSFEAIRETLAEAGVFVSRSTVQREVARHEQASTVVSVAGAVQPPDIASAPSVMTRPAAIARTELPSGQDIAEAFVRGRITNPLIRAKERR